MELEKQLVRMRSGVVAMTKTYSYDAVPYPDNPFPQSHPDRLATVATLFGMRPPDVEHCRVLELGSGRGGNLIPMAEQLPGGSFVGVELSQVQAEEAQRTIERLGLPNIAVWRKNILDIDASAGLFDYIIAHGVYSWVPPAVQDKILEICATNLAEQGVAYVSYNTYPGWNMRGMIRDMMCYHTGRFDDPQVRIEQARALLDFLAQNTSDKTAYGILLRGELDILKGHHDGYLFHEHLEDVNDPIYFHEFAERATSKGLQYLGEADVSVMYTGHMPADVVGALERVASDLIQMEQYIDFLRNRMFRQTLLCRQSVAIDRELKPADLESLFVSSSLAPSEARADLHSAAPLRFKHEGRGVTVTAHNPLLKAALVLLCEAWPARIAFPQLASMARSRVDPQPIVSSTRMENERYELGKVLLKFYVSELIDLHVLPTRSATRPGKRPIASGLARLQAESGKSVTTLSHKRRRLDDLEWRLLPCLDGAHDREALLGELVKLLDDKVLALQPEAAPGLDTRARLSEALEQSLAYLARAELLIGEDEHDAQA
jgi:methyltransferase-like protein/SAM-dependent methyltransferase